MSDEVLIAEIPRGGKGGVDAVGKPKHERWSQGNYTKDIMKKFFEIEPEPNTKQKKHFTWIDSSGVAHHESRPFGYRQSKNYGFELGAAAGVPYPKGTKRPIVVFRKLTSDSFVYQLLLPGSADHDVVDDYLQANYSGSKHHRSRIITTLAAAKVAWPTSRLWD